MFTPEQIGKNLLLRGAKFITGDDGGGGNLQYRADLFNFVYSFGQGWEHVSVSTNRRCPTWGEMCMFKDIFWPPTEACIQYHPAISEYINFHSFCLHIWRPENVQLPTPPSSMIGPKDNGGINHGA
jgi:hypothetical protein